MYTIACWLAFHVGSLSRCAMAQVGEKAIDWLAPRPAAQVLALRFNHQLRQMYQPHLLPVVVGQPTHTTLIPTASRQLAWLGFRPANPQGPLRFMRTHAELLL